MSTELSAEFAAEILPARIMPTGPMAAQPMGDGMYLVAVGDSLVIPLEADGIDVDRSGRTVDLPGGSEHWATSGHLVVSIPGWELTYFVREDSPLLAA